MYVTMGILRHIPIDMRLNAGVLTGIWQPKIPPFLLFLSITPSSHWPFNSGQRGWLHGPLQFPRAWRVPWGGPWLKPRASDPVSGLWISRCRSAGPRDDPALSGTEQVLRVLTSRPAGLIPPPRNPSCPGFSLRECRPGACKAAHGPLHPVPKGGGGLGVVVSCVGSVFRNGSSSQV